MKIGIFIGYLQKETIGGGFTFQSSIINALSSILASHEFYFYYRANNNFYEKLETNHKFINLNEIYTIIEGEKRRSSFAQVVEKDKIDFVYYITPTIEKTECPYLLTIWDLGHRVLSCFPEVSVSGWTFESRENCYAQNIPRASYVMIGNEAGKNQIKRYYGFDEERIITNPMITPDYVYFEKADTSILTRNHLIKNKYLFYPAQFWPHKNHIRILKAMKELKKQGFKVVFTGSDVGNMTYIKEKTKEFGLEEDVLFLGFVNRNELIALYQNAYALVYASMLGPDNIPPLEAMALKCPVICADFEGAKDQLKDSALYFNAVDENGIIQNVEKLKDKKQRQQFISEGEKLAKSCNIDNYIKKVIQIFDEFALIRECWSSDKKYIHL